MGNKTCPRCGAEMSEFEITCRYCGYSEKRERRTCPKCSAVLEDGINYCPNCGAKAPKISIPSVKNAPKEDDIFSSAPDYKAERNDSSDSKRALKKGKLIVTALVVLAVAIVFTELFGTRREKTEKMYVDLYEYAQECIYATDDATNLVLNVWYNSIYQVDDKDTDRYTKENDGSGKFYEDFNDALDTLLLSDEYEKMLENIYDYESDALKILLDLREYNGADTDLVDTFSNFFMEVMSYIDMADDPQGSFSSYYEDILDMDDVINSYLDELSVLMEKYM